MSLSLSGHDRNSHFVDSPTEVVVWQVAKHPLPVKPTECKKWCGGR